MIAAIAVGAAWRLGVLAVDKWHQQILLNDSVYYTAQAQQLAHGTWFREIFVDQPGAEHGPLTSFLLASVSWLDDPIAWQRLVTTLFGIGTIVAIAALGKAIGGARLAAVAAWIAAIYPNLWMNDGLVMSESLSMLLVTLTLLFARPLLIDRDRAAAPPRWRAPALLGLAAGAAALARSELIVVVAALVVLVAVAMPAVRGVRLRAAAIVLAASLALMAPWVVFNLVRFERPVFLTTNDGTTLLGSYCDASFHGPGAGGWNIGCVTNDPEYRVDEEPSVRSSRQRSIALSYARAHAGELPRVIGARIGRTLDLYGLRDLVAQDVGEERYRWASWAGIVSWWALAPCAAIGLWRMDRRWRRLLLLPVGSVLLTTVVFYGGHRIRSSLEPVAIVAAAALVARILEHRSGKHEHDDEHAGVVEVLEVTGPRGVDEEAAGELASQHEQPEDGGQRGGGPADPTSAVQHDRDRGEASTHDGP